MLHSIWNHLIWCLFKPRWFQTHTTTGIRAANQSRGNPGLVLGQRHIRWTSITPISVQFIGSTGKWSGTTTRYLKMVMTHCIVMYLPVIQELSQLPQQVDLDFDIILNYTLYTQISPYKWRQDEFWCWTNVCDAGRVLTAHRIKLMLQFGHIWFALDLHIWF